jgi:hypothetical protein
MRKCVSSTMCKDIPKRTIMTVGVCVVPMLSVLDI